jgi:hypothetical protein
MQWGNDDHDDDDDDYIIVPHNLIQFTLHPLSSQPLMRVTGHGHFFTRAIHSPIIRDSYDGIPHFGRPFPD